MIPAAFDYVRPSSLDEAIDLLVEHGDEAKVLAGGHSLIPLLRLRFARPSVLVDVGMLDELAYVRESGNDLAIGALTRYHALLASPVLCERAGLLAEVVARIGDPQVRHRGTIGGSVAHGDPAADLPATLVALRCNFVVRGPRGERVIGADDFFLGFLETALEADELLTEVRVPLPSAPAAFEKFNRRSQDWAIVGCAVALGPVPRVALVNMGTVPVRSRATEAALVAGSSIEVAAALADTESTPSSDQNASADYRRHLARVLVRRALERAVTEGEDSRWS